MSSTSGLVFDSTNELAGESEGFARALQQQAIQIAVNNAIVTIQERDPLCLEIAAQINRLLPFSCLNLRIGIPSEASSYWLMLRKNPGGTFERVNIRTFLNREIDRDVLDKLDREAPVPLENLTAIFTGDSFDSLCNSYLTAQSCRDNFGARSAALFPVLLKRASVASINLASTETDAFTTSAYNLVHMVMPQIALALDNLLAYEEIETRQQLKTAELAIVSAFQNGRDMAGIVQKVGTAINALIPVDIFSIFRPERLLSSDSIGAFVQKKAGVFRPLTEDELPLAETVNQPGWQAALTDMKSWVFQPALNVGEHQNLGQQNLVRRAYKDVFGTKSSAIMPVISQGQPIASLILMSRAAYAFTQKDLDTLQGLSTLMVMAFENLLAYERIRVLSEQLEREKTYLSEEIKTTHNFEEIIGTSPALLKVFNDIGQVAETDYTVLILGETGTGKELVARAIHNLSDRRNRPMVKINCAALPPQLIESELFGHERGSFTGATEKRIGKFELAHNGTIFLDEIGELPLDLQSKLLRAIQEKEIERIGGKGSIVVDVRIIAATNRNLSDEIAAGRFRTDLYYRLNVFPIEVPPLRNRREDILPLAMYFLQKISKKLGKPLTGIANASLQQMAHYGWPGNIRELEHILERAAILARTTTLELAELLMKTTEPEVNPAIGAVLPLENAIRAIIRAALVQSNNRIRGAGGAAELLDIKPTTLEARMKKLKIGKA